jgi:hypothetical protein
MYKLFKLRHKGRAGRGSGGFCGMVVKMLVKIRASRGGQGGVQEAFEWW